MIQKTLDAHAAPDRASLYIHIPFCLAKCRYCSFFSLPLAGWDLSAYLADVTRQATFLARHPWTRSRQFQSLYLGGGTPTVCDPLALGRLVAFCQEAFPFAPAPEVTVEANPQSLTAEGLRILADAGVNRISLGIQAFNNPLLARLGRPHTAGEAMAAAALVKDSGFTSWNLDLIYGCPDQTPAAWEAALATAVSLGPDHLSLYELTIEESTPFMVDYRQGRLQLPSEDEVLAMEDITRAITSAAGYERYEISNYSRPGRESRHNILYWENGSYLGLGAGAVSCIDGLRLHAVADPRRYSELVAKDQYPGSDGEALSLAASFRESVIMGMRMLAGVSLARLRSRYGIDAAAYYGSLLDELTEQGFVEITRDRLRLTARGLPVANQILAQLV